MHGLKYSFLVRRSTASSSARVAEVGQQSCITPREDLSQSQNMNDLFNGLLAISNTPQELNYVEQLQKSHKFYDPSSCDSEEPTAWAKNNEATCSEATRRLHQDIEVC